MFDIGFWELALIFVLALLVLGPERLPRLASQLGHWAGQARRMARLLTTQLRQEFEAADPSRVFDDLAPTRRASSASYSRPGMEELRPGSAQGTPPAAERSPAGGASDTGPSS